MDMRSGIVASHLATILRMKATQRTAKEIKVMFRAGVPETLECTLFLDLTFAKQTSWSWFVLFIFQNLLQKAP
jgi:hypothetical protein